jgi:hypothetical protein
MVRGTNTKGLVLLAVFFGTVNADGALTHNIVGCQNTRSEKEVVSSVNVEILPENGDITGPYKPHLFSFRGDFHRQTVSYSDPTNRVHSIKSLPPAPGTFLLVLFGFLLVSAIRDRKMWLASLATILITGQTGFSLLPHIASYLCSKSRGNKCFCSFLHSSRPQIFHSLWLKNNDQFPATLGELIDILCMSARLNLSSAGYNILCDCGDEVVKTEQQKPFPQNADSTGKCCLDYDFVFRVRRTRQHAILSTCIVNSRLARGPPRLLKMRQPSY